MNDESLERRLIELIVQGEEGHEGSEEFLRLADELRCRRADPAAVEAYREAFRKSRQASRTSYALGELLPHAAAQRVRDEVLAEEEKERHR